MYSMNALGSINLARYLLGLDKVWKLARLGMYLCRIKIRIVPDYYFSCYNGLKIITGN